MRYYGYHRTSTKEQHLDRGIKAISDFCTERNIKLEMLYTDQQTGKDFKRDGYENLKKQIEYQVITNNEQCALIVSELDRLGRNKELTLKEIRHFQDIGVRIMVLEIPTTLTDLSLMENNNMAKMMMDTINNMLIEMYASFAHAEMQKREKRQHEGIEAKKARGEWSDYGRPVAIDYNIFAEEYQKVVDGKLKPFECMRALGMTKPTFYRYKQKFEKGSN